ncbi:MAG: DUF547 domain-containing protein [Pseudomonadota bacterium]|jgi:hypothetical protein
MSLRLLTAWVLLLLGAGAQAAAGTVPQAQDWAEWNRSDEANPAAIDHGVWDGLLHRYVVEDHQSGINRFRYGEVAPADRAALDGYIAALAALEPRRYRRAEQLAYWINLYNALTVQLILDHFPVTEVSGIRIDGVEPWRAPLVTVAGRPLSLDDIEHRILVPIWKDHRILFGLACGGLGCPDIQPRACTGPNSRELLTGAGRRFINSERGLSIAGARGPLRASRVLETYEREFGQDRKAFLRLMAHYAEDRKALYLLGYGGAIQYQDDWTLNAP